MIQKRHLQLKISIIHAFIVKKRDFLLDTAVVQADASLD